jgi:hypothetical protein
MFPVLLTIFPVAASEIPCSFASGIIQESPEFAALLARTESRECAFFADFPVSFPDIREFDAETGCRLTASSASLISDQSELAAKRDPPSTIRRE